MQADFLDRYSRLDSPIHRLDAGFKLLMALAIVIFIVAPPLAQVYLLGAAAGLLIVIAAVSRIPPGFLLRRLLMLEPLVLGVLILNLFQPGGWRLFLLLGVKCTLCLFTMILLANSTPFSELLRVLQRLHLPGAGLMITTLSLMYRYLFVLADESARMKRARASRTFTVTRRRSWRNAAGVIGQLFIRASERAERIYAAMCARGWR